MTSSQDNQPNTILDLSNGNKGFAMIPYIIIDLLQLTPSALALYLIYKRTCGECKTGSCWKKSKTLMKEMGVSKNFYLKCRDELEKKRPELNGKSLINVQQRLNDKDEYETTVITLNDVWHDNFKYLLGVVHHVNHPSSPHELGGSSPHEPIKKNTTLEEKNNKLASLADANASISRNRDMKQIDETHVTEVEEPSIKSFFQPTSATMKLNVARMSDLCLPPDEASKLCRYDPEIIEKAMKHLEKQTEVVRKPYTWLQNCIRQEWWDEKAQINKQLDYYTMFKTSLNELCKQIRLFTRIVVGEGVIRAYEANGEVREFSKKSFKTESSTLSFLSNFNSMLQAKNFTKKLVIVKINSEKTSTINIVG